jgi:hypothetical protein
MATDDEEFNEIEEAFLRLADAIADEACDLRVLAMADGTTYPAICDARTNEVIALLCIPPRYYDLGTVN